MDANFAITFEKMKLRNVQEVLLDKSRETV